MSFHTEATLAGYARAVVDLRIHMAEVSATPTDLTYLRELLASRVMPAMLEHEDKTTVVESLVDAIGRATKAAWAHGDSFVLAPAMTAIIAAAAEALDLTGGLLTAEAAPCDTGTARRSPCSPADLRSRPPRPRHGFPAANNPFSPDAADAHPPGISTAHTHIGRRHHLAMTPAHTRSLDDRQWAGSAAHNLDQRAARAHRPTPTSVGIRIRRRSLCRPATARQRAAVGCQPGNARYDKPPATAAGRRR